MTTSRSITPPNESIQWAAFGNPRPPAPPLLDATNQSTSAPMPAGSASRAPADRSSERRLRSATPESTLKLLDLPNELLLDQIDFMNFKAVVELSEVNRRFKQLTAPIRHDYQHAHESILRIKNLEKLSSDPHTPAGTDDSDTELASIGSPRFEEFNSILGMANQVRHAKLKTSVLGPLAESIPDLSPGEQRIKAFNSVSVAAGSQPAGLHAQVLTTLARIFDDLPQGKPRLDAVNGLLTAVHALPREHRVSVLTTLAGKLNALDDDQPINDIANRIIVEAAELTAADNQMVLKQLVEGVRTLPSQESRSDIYRATTVAAEKLPADSRQPVLLLLVNNLSELPRGPARTLAVNRVLDATDQIPPEHKCEVLSPMAMNIRLLADGAPRTLALSAILNATTKIPEKEQYLVLKELASNLRFIEEGQPKIDALDSILLATNKVPVDQKGSVLLPLAVAAHTLPEAASIGAFKRVFAEAKTMDASLNFLFLGNFLAEISQFERTPRQMIGELSELIELIATLDPTSRGTLLNRLTADSGYRDLQGEHSVDAFSRILAMTSGMHESMQAFVVRNMGDWVANLPEGQRIDGVKKLVDQVENQIPDLKKAVVLDKITDPDLFIRLLPKEHIGGAFSEMLGAVVKMPFHNKKNALSNLANSIKFLPDAEIIPAFKAVAAATANIPSDDRREVLNQFAKNIGLFAEGQSRTHTFNGIIEASAEILPKFRGTVLQSLVESIGLLDEGQARTNAFDGIIHANIQIPDEDKVHVLKALAENLSLVDEGQPRIDALDSILRATNDVLLYQKSNVLLPLAFGAHTLPEAASIDAFRRVMTGVETILFAKPIFMLLVDFLREENRIVRTPRQMIGEFNALIDVAENLPPCERVKVLDALAAHSDYRSMCGEHSIEAFNRVFAATTNEMPDSARASVAWNMGDWVARLPEGQRIDAVSKLLAQFKNQISNDNKTLVFNKITDPDLFIRVLPTDHVGGIFMAMLDAVVKLPSNEKEIALSNLAKSIKYLPDDEKIASFKAVTAATADMSLNGHRANVLTEMQIQIQYIPNASRNEAHDAIAIQAANLTPHYKRHFLKS